MAKFADIKKERVIKLEINGIEGLYMKDLSASQFDAIFSGNADDNVKLVESIFTEVICGEDGTAFDEFVEGGFEKISEHVGAVLIQDIIWAIKDILIPSPEQLGN